MEQAAELGYTALALTDECSLAGVVRAHSAAKDLPLKLIIGSEFELKDALPTLKTQEEAQHPTPETLQFKSVENYACSAD